MYPLERSFFLYIGDMIFGEGGGLGWVILLFHFFFFIFGSEIWGVYWQGELMYGHHFTWQLLLDHFGFPAVLMGLRYLSEGLAVRELNEVQILLRAKGWNQNFKGSYILLAANFFFFCFSSKFKLLFDKWSGCKLFPESHLQIFKKMYILMMRPKRIY